MELVHEERRKGSSRKKKMQLSTVCFVREKLGGFGYSEEATGREKVLKEKKRKKETVIFAPLESLYGAHPKIPQQALMELGPGTVLGTGYVET